MLSVFSDGGDLVTVFGFHAVGLNLLDSKTSQLLNRGLILNLLWCVLLLQDLYLGYHHLVLLMVVQHLHDLHPLTTLDHEIGVTPDEGGPFEKSSVPPRCPRSSRFRNIQCRLFLATMPKEEPW